MNKDIKKDTVFLIEWGKNDKKCSVAAETIDKAKMELERYRKNYSEKTKFKLFALTIIKEYLGNA